MADNVMSELEILEKLAEKIPSGISAEVLFKNVYLLNAKNREEFQASFVNEGITDFIKKQLETFWKNFEVQEKLDRLKYLPPNTINKERPMSNPRNAHLTIFNSAKVKLLKDAINRVQQDIDEMKKTSSEIRNYIEDQKLITNEQLTTLRNLTKQEIQ